MNQNGRGLLAYLPQIVGLGWVGGLIVLFAFKDNTKLTNFHACQSITLSVIVTIIAFAFAIVSGIISGVASATGAPIGFLSVILSLIQWGINIGAIVLAIIAAIKANKEEEFEIPGVAGLTKTLFKSKLA